MSKKRKTDNSGIVYSTDPDFQFQTENTSLPDTLSPEAQLLKVQLESKHRAGKLVTLIKGFVGADSDLEFLGKQIKNFCGTGGSVKDGEIIIQGNQREKVMQYLQKSGYKKAKAI